MFVRELRVSYESRADLPLDPEARVGVPSKAVSYLNPILESEPVEVFVVLCLSARFDVLCFREIARGGVDTVQVSAAEVFKAVLLSNAPCFLVAHNHPSGDPSPSQEDRAITVRLSEGAKLLNLTLLDHVIVGAGRHFSFKEVGQL